MKHKILGQTYQAIRVPVLQLMFYTSYIPDTLKFCRNCSAYLYNVQQIAILIMIFSFQH